MKWYKFYPSDTLFFRGAEPMSAGINYETTLNFPPSVSVISGAIRTAVLAQKSITIDQYKKGNPISEYIGKYGQKAPFTITGPLIGYRDNFYVPAPYTLFTDAGINSKKIKILKPVNFEDSLKNRLGLKSSTTLQNWVKRDVEVKSIGGNWISFQGLINKRKKYEDGKSIFMLNKFKTNLSSIEERTGIAFDQSRKIKQSQLYTARHIRLKKGASLIWGVNKDCKLDPEGVLVLGGEQRFGHYKEVKLDPVISTSGDEYLALSPILVTDLSKSALIATGKISYRGGWNLAKQFHKDMEAFYPAGSVFSKNINNCCAAF